MRNQIVHSGRVKAKQFDPNKRADHKTMVHVSCYDGGSMWSEVIPAAWIETLEVIHTPGKKGWQIFGKAINGRKFMLFISWNTHLKTAWENAKINFTTSPRGGEKGFEIPKTWLFT